MEELISLIEWAKREGIDPSTARYKALAGNLKTARKIGRNWVISSSEKNIDLRFKENRNK